jgi:hypothetical protein
MEIEIFGGEKIKDVIDELGNFRITIFKEYPYLYDGNLDYERKYLSRYGNISDSILLLVRDKEGILGAATGIPLVNDEPEFTEPFKDKNLDEIFYIGELMIRKDNRSKGIGTLLLKNMLDLIDKNQFKTVCLYTVDRGNNHPLKPDFYQSPDSLWRKFGFEKHSSHIVYLSWRDLGNVAETKKPMNVWIKDF